MISGAGTGHKHPKHLPEILRCLVGIGIVDTLNSGHTEKLQKLYES
jgi:hypothetical protein